MSTETPLILTGMAQLVERCTAKQRVNGLMPVLCQLYSGVRAHARVGCRRGPPLGRMGEATNQYFLSYIDVSLSPSPLPPHSLFRGKRGREVSMYGCGCLSRAPTGEVAETQGDWESNQQPFGSQADTQSTEPHQPGPSSLNK